MPVIFSTTLLRHGFAEISEGQCIGQLDVSLTNDGVDAISDLAQNWPSPFPERIYCSDLSRTMETAQILAEHMNIGIASDPRLREINFGDWEGKSWEEIYDRDPDTMRAWGSDWINIPPPGGESVQQLHARIADFYEETLNRPNLPQTPTLVVAHAGSLRVLACLLHRRPMEALFDLDFHHGAPVSMV